MKGWLGMKLKMLVLFTTVDGKNRLLGCPWKLVTG